MPNQIRWGILGTGTIARKFAAGLALLPDARIQAVGSRDRSKAGAFAKETDAVRAHGSYEELARDAEVDVVYIATPHAQHRDNCRLALENGKAVLCEKPFAVEPAHAREVIVLARERGLFCMEAMWMRYVPLLPELEGLLRSGAIGEPQILIAQLGWPIRNEPGRRIFDPAVGGGALLDLGVYPVSLAFRLFGRPKHVDSQVVLGRTGVDEQAALMLEHDGGRQSMLTTSIRGILPNDAVVLASEGSIRIHAPIYCPQSLTILRGTPRSSGAGRGSRLKSLARIGWVRRIRSVLTVARGTTVSRPTLGEGYAHEAMEVMRCLRAGERESPGMPLDESVAILEVIDAARKKRRS